MTLDESWGHWDINWEGVATDCSPGMTGCTGAPTNNLELDNHRGGPLAIDGLEGAGNLIFAYDANSNAWMIAGSGTGIGMPLDEVETNDVVAMQTFTSYTVTPTGPTITTIPLTTGFGSSTNGGDWDGPYSFTVPAGSRETRIHL